jgi:Arc/MetJ-type ribon-helix-helix transcriptional regulator
MPRNNGQNMIQINVRVTPEMYDMIRQLSEGRYPSASEFIREAIAKKIVEEMRRVQALELIKDRRWSYERE